MVTCSFKLDPKDSYRWYMVESREGTFGIAIYECEYDGSDWREVAFIYNAKGETGITWS